MKESLQYDVSPYINECYNFQKINITELEKHGVPLNYPSYQTVLNFGDVTPGIYFIIEGMAEAHFSSLDGQEKLIFIMKKYSLFGECPFFNKSQSNLQVTVWPESKLIFFDENSIEYLIRNNDIFQNLIIKSIARKSQIMAEQLKDSYLSTEQRICKTLEYICNEKPSEDGKCHLNITQNELAYIVGLARVTIARVCSNLKKYNIIENTNHSKKHLCINMENLIRYNNFYR
jgi:Cyclic nucleotide-binding domain.